MINLDIEQVIPNVFFEDINLNGRNTCISQLTILTIKSLLPMEDAVGNKVDYKRFGEELKLWKEYCIGEDVSLLYSLKRSDQSSYLSYFDKTFYTRLIPIVIVNNNFEILEEEIIKNILYFSGHIPNLFEWLLTGLLLHLLRNKDKDIIDSLKEYIINFSQIEFMDKYKQYFAIEINDISNNLKISFEKERITILNILNGIKSKEYGYLQDLLMVIDGNEPSTSISNIVYRSSNDIAIEKVDGFYMNMNKYILKLSKGRIYVDDLEIKEYILPDIFDFKEGEEFFHSLLNYSKVIKKEAKDDGLTSLINTKSGNYLFKRDPI